MEAAADMNCKTYASECDEPDRLKYHCVINAFGGLVEVCAYAQFILFGKCTEYNGRNLIEGSDDIFCKNFTYNPCPSNYYNSTDAYKYQECYGSYVQTVLPQSTTSHTYLNGMKEKNKSGVNLPDITVLAILIVIALTEHCLVDGEYIL
nr:uncharacterized protein LOC111101767 isoform X2 [Crassostrea virginica]